MRLPRVSFSMAIVEAVTSVGAMVKYMPKGYDSPIHILRWYDTAWSN